MLATLAFMVLGSQQDSLSDMEQDILFLEQELPRVHYKFTDICSEVEWKLRCTETRGALPSLPEGARLLKLSSLVASLGVAHTLVSLDSSRFRLLPIKMRAFDDGIWITSTIDEYGELRGAKVLSVGGRTPSAVISNIAAFSPAENPYWKLSNFANWSQIYDAYQAADLAGNEGLVVKCQLTNGLEKKFTLHPMVYKQTLTAVADATKLPAYYSGISGNYAIKDSQDKRTLIFDYRSCAEDQNYPMQKASQEFWERFEMGGYVNVAIDLRQNGGGNSAVLNPMMKEIGTRKELTNSGRVFVFVSRNTFSSAMLNAVQMRFQGATLVGEPIGGSPNSYGEVKYFRLPNTGITVNYCTKHYNLGPDREANTVYPGVYAPIRWDDLIQGRDACLEAIKDLNPR